jgi:hypothetical protein
MSYIETIVINSSVKQIVFHGSFGSMYYRLEINGNIYSCPFDIHFPVEWAINEKYRFYDDKMRGTGPYRCNYCRNHGFWQGVFIGYCGSCAETHSYEKGRGLAGCKTDQGKPYEFDILLKNGIMLNIPKEKSIFSKYLKDVDVKLIGDQDLMNKYSKGYFMEKDEKFDEDKEMEE